MLITEEQIKELGFDAERRQLHKNYPEEGKYLHKTHPNYCIIVSHGTFSKQPALALPKTKTPLDNKDLSFVYVGVDFERGNAGRVFFKNYMENFESLKEACKIL